MALDRRRSVALQFSFKKGFNNGILNTNIHVGDVIITCHYVISNECILQNSVLQYRKKWVPLQGMRVKKVDMRKAQMSSKGV